MPFKVAGIVEPGKNPHRWFSHDSDAERQFDPSMPWFGRVAPLLTSLPPCTVVLDCGCNSGGLGRLLTERGCYVVGLDLALHFLPLALKKGYVGAIQADAASLPFRDNAFPVVILSEILEHVPDAERCVSEAARVLMPHGWLLGDVPSAIGKWGWRSLRGHKWHRDFYTKRKLRALLGAHLKVSQISYRWASWRAGDVLPQWVHFKAVKP